MNTLYFVFANDPKQPLKELNHEDSEISSLIDPLAANGELRSAWDSFATVEKVTDKLLNNRKDLTLFHYSGHAGHDMLGLEGGQAYATGIAEQLSKCKQLKVVVLNGCATHGQVERLHQLGVPAVLATYIPVGDAQAAEFAIRFYRSLVLRRETLKTAFDDTCNYILTKDNQVERDPETRGLVLRQKVKHNVCWTLSFAPGHEDMATWTLFQNNAQASDNNSEFTKRVRAFIAAGKTEEALKELLQATENTHPDMHNEFLGYSERFKQLSRKVRIGIIGNSEAGVERNQIVFGILGTLEELNGDSAG